MTPNAFLTGSQIYGAPHNESDIDVVILADSRTIRLLMDFVGTGDEQYDQLSFKFGKLNLLVARDQGELECWIKGTEELLRRKNDSGRPVLREEAIAVFRALRAQNKEKGEG